MVRKILKFFLYLIIAFVCLVIFLFAYSKYEDFKNPPPTPEERIKIKERNERLNSCLDDNIKYYSSSLSKLRWINEKCEAYAKTGIEIDFNDNSGLKEIEKSKDYDQRYNKCYGEMTNAHKARGFHQSNRNASINVKEAVCSAYAKGEEINYEGKR
mgnify:FL=1|jgi:hypothetical protein